MDKSINEQELAAFIAQKTQASTQDIRLVLKHEEAYIQKAHKDAKEEVDIDSDDLVDYILEQKDIKLDELTVERILESEMEYLIQNGHAEYMD
ncbi:hypothetical protein [Paenibacillus lemnae]|uniref:Uncharacterized protein n=1 Tax=Paenibacillus lemnae TaxID=1330551 RepID=A0A848MAR7_PAELE|nr:hypothetical protein [Paenibacillus lemnae]NMO97349.1 hypothetical protein [Paenibacillus lemnae]